LSPIAIAITAFALILTSALTGMFLHSRLPQFHLAGDSKDVIKLATAMIGTISALVLALLFASTRTSFDSTSANVSRMTADIVELDQLLEEYGPEAQPVRTALRAEVGPWVDQIWREAAQERGAKAMAKTNRSTILDMVRALKPQNPAQASIQERGLQVLTDLRETRLALFAQPDDSLSTTFMIVLVIWLMFIFTVFGMSAPPNPTLATVLVLCVLSVSTAIYLIQELGQPFDGLMQLSSAGLRNALH
jgi:Protein of unknown function (DUF4239)